MDPIIIDVRDKEHYEGRVELLDTIATAGQIPGTTILPYAANFTNDGFVKDPGVCKDKYGFQENVCSSEKRIIHCGFGVTKCHNKNVMDYAGLEITNLYVGSRSEWSRNYSEEIETI